MLACLWCLVQWGYATRSGVGDTTFTFPISFSTIYCVNAGRYFSSRDSSNSGFGVMSQSTTTCVTYTGASQTKAMTILAIGIQQWGNTQSSSSSFPIAFNSVCYAVIPTEYVTWNIEGNTSLFGNISKTGFTCYNLDRRKYYIACGVQQWGHTNTSSDAAITIKFPITFSTVYCVSISKTSDNTSYAAMLRTCIQSFNTSQFVTRGGYQTYCDWVAVGKT